MKKLVAGGLLMGALVNAQANCCCFFCPAAFGIAAVGAGVLVGTAAYAASQQQSYYDGGYYYAAPPADYYPAAPAVMPQPAAAPALPSTPASPMSSANNLFGR
jgi:hypothetical protein